MRRPEPRESAQGVAGARRLARPEGDPMIPPLPAQILILRSPLGVPKHYMGIFFFYFCGQEGVRRVSVGGQSGQ